MLAQFIKMLLNFFLTYLVYDKYGLLEATIVFMVLGGIFDINYYIKKKEEGINFD